MSGDHELDSNHSGDGSNADSGRGASEEGENAHRVHPDAHAHPHSASESVSLLRKLGTARSMHNSQLIYGVPSLGISDIKVNAVVVLVYIYVTHMSWNAL